MDADPAPISRDDSHYHDDMPWVPPPKYRATDSSTPLTSWSSAFIADKPQSVQDGVIRLMDLQHRYTRLMMQYQEEAAALERKYQALAQPLYEARTATISGILDPTTTTSTSSYAHPSGRRSSNKTSPPSLSGMSGRSGSGIPDFWLSALKNEPSIADLIAPRDEPVLALLRDIRLEGALPGGRRGFALVFVFAPNPWFRNAELRKTYTYARAVDGPGGEAEAVEDIYGSDYTYHESFGDVVEWERGRNLVELREEAGEDEEDGDVDDDRRESFFALFSPPEKPVGVEEDSEEMRRFLWLLELDFDYGEVFKDKVIPYAVHWYTGEARLYEDEDDDDEDDDDEEEDDEDEDEEDDDDDDDEEEEEEEHHHVVRRRY